MNAVRLSVRFSLIAAVAATAMGAQAQTLIVSSEKDNQLAIMNTDGAIEKTIPVCKRPRHMALIENKAKVLVACGDSHQLAWSIWRRAK